MVFCEFNAVLVAAQPDQMAPAQEGMFLSQFLHDKESKLATASSTTNRLISFSAVLFLPSELPGLPSGAVVELATFLAYKSSLSFELQIERLTVSFFEMGPSQSNTKRGNIANGERELAQSTVNRPIKNIGRSADEPRGLIFL